MKGGRIDRLTRERLLEVLEYNKYTGDFFWIKKLSPMNKIGSLAGCIDKNGYRKITIDREQHYGHRLAFLYVTGKIPQEVDHRDLNRSNNKWKNLREAAPLDQMRNRGTPKSNTSGHKGVRREGSGWRARIKVNGKKLHLGTFSEIEDACAAYAAAVKLYFGEFAKV